MFNYIFTASTKKSTFSLVVSVFYLTFAPANQKSTVPVSVENRKKDKRKAMRGVAQSGSAPGLGPGGRRFESCRPDKKSFSS